MFWDQAALNSVWFRNTKVFFLLLCHVHVVEQGGCNLARALRDQPKGTISTLRMSTAVPNVKINVAKCTTAPNASAHSWLAQTSNMSILKFSSSGRPALSCVPKERQLEFFPPRNYLNDSLDLPYHFNFSCI